MDVHLCLQDIFKNVFGLDYCSINLLLFKMIDPYHMKGIAIEKIFGHSDSSFMIKDKIF